jgi:hypothetical protein
MYVVDFDDLCDEFDPWEELHALHDKHPGFRCTLFAIPSRCSDELLARYRALDWVELGVHGYHHAARECQVWGYDEAAAKLKELEALGWTKLFKAPNWQYSEHLYRACSDLGWKVADHMAFAYPSGRMLVERYTHNLPGNEGYHGHTWETVRNGPLNWDVEDRSDYAFVSEACKETDWGWSVYDDDQDEFASWSTNSNFGKASAKNAVHTLTKLGVDKGDSIVDFGGNDGFVPTIVKENGWNDVWSVEACPKRSLYSHQHYRLPTICADLQRLPIANETFDWGYCSHTVEHIPDLKMAWEEMKRLCRKGIIVVAPVETDEFAAENPAHLRNHTAAEWCELLGLELIEDRGHGDGLGEVLGVWRR